MIKFSKTSLSALVAALGVCAFAPLASAAQGDERPPRGAARMMEQLDADKSGTISLAEFSSRSDSQFAETDTDGNGSISEEEREAFAAAKQAEMEERRAEMEQNRAARRQSRREGIEERMTERLEQIDTNGDGLISKAEHDAVQQTRFAALDLDSNGEITQEEFAQARKNRGRGMRRRNSNSEE